jgi:peptidoglycan/LPS O-acetylase OafA/YrhL
VVNAPKTGYLPTLDGWRAIAIVAVLLDHTVEYSGLGHYPKLVSFTHTGPNGVSLFFAISGFLICSRLLEEKRAFGQISLRGFFITMLLESGVLKWMGRLSYSLYLWQQLFSVPAGSSFSILQTPPVSTVMIFLCAWLSYRFIERPFIRWGHRLAPPLTEGRDDLAPNRHETLKAGNEPAGVADKLG